MTHDDTGHAPAVTATIEFSYDRDQIARMAGDLPLASMLALDSPTTQEMRLTVAANAWQLDLDGPTVFGSGMTLIRHRHGGGEYRHHATRTRLSFEAKEVPPASVKRPGRWHVVEHPDRIEVRLEDSVTGARWIQRIRTGERCEHAELGKDFVEALLACTPQTSHYPVDKVAALIAERGLPAEVTLTAEGSDRPISRFTVSGATVVAAPSGRADQAKSYRDLRDPANHNIWEEGGPDLRRIEPKNLDDIRPSDDGQMLGATVRMRRRNDDSEPDPKTPLGGGSATNTGGSGNSAPPVLTNDAQVALRIEQRLLDDIQMTVNQIAAHLTGIETLGTDLAITWLEDTVNSARRLAPFTLVGGAPTRTMLAVPGTGLPALLHEDPGPRVSDDLTTGNLKACMAGGGRGIIDRMAAKRVADYLTTGSVPATGLAALDPTDRAAIVAALGLLPVTSRLGSLSLGLLTRFIAAVAFEDIGTLRFSLAGLLEQFDIDDLYLIQLTALKILVSFPPPTTTTDGTPLQAPLLSGLRCRAGGTIEGAISLPMLSVRAQIGRTPTPLYWALLFAGPFAAIFVPQVAWVLPILWTITLFLASDYAALKLDAKLLNAAFSVSFVPGPSSRALQPQVSVRLTGNISSSILSFVPTGIHQLVDAAVVQFINLFGITISLLEGQLASAIQSSLTKLMGDGVPGGLLRLGVPVASGLAAGVDDDYVYLEATLGQPANPAIQIVSVPVSAGLEFDLDRDVVAKFGADGNAGRGRHYLSVAGTINAVNQVAAVLWQRGEFNASIATGSAAFLLPLLSAPFNGAVSRIDTIQLAPPVFSLPPGGPGGPRHYFDVVFPSFLFGINAQSANSWSFRYRITCRGAFGLGTVPIGGRFLSIAGIRNNIFEAMLDPTSVNAVLLDAWRREKKTITVHETGDDPRHPQVGRTVHETVFETTDMTAGAPPSWAQYGSGIFCLANGGRDVGLIPRLDHSMSNGMAPADPVGPIDGAIQETYTLDGSDPDDAQKSISGVNVPAYAQMPVDWGFGQGLALAHLETAGALSILSGTPESLNSFATVDAMFLYPFLAKLNL